MRSCREALSSLVIPAFRGLHPGCRRFTTASVTLVAHQATKVTGQLGPRIRHTTGPGRGSSRCPRRWPLSPRHADHAAPGLLPRGPTRPHPPVPAATRGPRAGHLAAVVSVRALIRNTLDGSTVWTLVLAGPPTSTAIPSTSPGRA